MVLKIGSNGEVRCFDPLYWQFLLEYDYQGGFCRFNVSLLVAPSLGMISI
jgi:hypothetical protein